MGAAGALLLLLIACGSEAAFQEGAVAEVPEDVRGAYVEAARARYALVSCRGPEQLQAIGGLDSARTRAEEALVRRFAGLDLTAVKAAADREMSFRQVEECAGEASIDRYRQAVGRLRQLGEGAN